VRGWKAPGALVVRGEEGGEGAFTPRAVCWPVRQAAKVLRASAALHAAAEVGGGEARCRQQEQGDPHTRIRARTCRCLKCHGTGHVECATCHGLGVRGRAVQKQ
jgi:hypothetical protein